MRWYAGVALAGMMVTALTGCEDALIPYLLKQGFKQGGLLLRTRPVDDVIRDPMTDARTERFLRLAKEVLKFARDEVGQDPHRSYQRYIALERSWVTQVVMAAPKDKFESYLFQYPVFGGLPYKGFFDEEDAKRLEAKLKDQNLDVYRREVEAYSTAGFLPDPLISTMFSDEGRLLELLFHELTHATFYFKGEADFNEAFASWVGHAAALDFLAKRPELLGERSAEIGKEIEANHDFQQRLAVIVKGIVKEAKLRYAQATPATADQVRADFFAWVKAEFAKNPGFERYATYNWNNASLLSLSTYYDYVPAIEAYAQAHHLTVKSFLALVVKQGPSIMAEIKPASPR